MGLWEQLCYESHHAPPKNDAGGTEVSTGVASFLKDTIPAPKAFSKRFFNIRHWTDMPCGGHFAALEEPELLVEAIRTFFRSSCK
ncbi:hypothetical protein [Spirosoma validum]|uniref:Alpha/beta hydrolase n=1 Tax=Spirosoma validum TaxID=2771355 RepID=A0A927B1G0_9BACT|nr:hypothetical protein [Spirosoma validum]MBD2753616.1 hypothetical protein [Spirosoma validum]